MLIDDGRLVELLDSMTKRLNLNSRVETLNHAVSLLDWAAEEAARGRAIGSYDRATKDFREVVLLVLRGHSQAGHEPPPAPVPSPPWHTDYKDLKGLVRGLKGDAEREAIARALEQTRWNRKEAARQLRISYKALLYKIRRYNIDQA